MYEAKFTLITTKNDGLHTISLPTSQTVPSPKTPHRKSTAIATTRAEVMVSHNQPSNQSKFNDTKGTISGSCLAVGVTSVITDPRKIPKKAFEPTRILPWGKGRLPQTLEPISATAEGTAAAQPTIAHASTSSIVQLTTAVVATTATAPLSTATTANATASSARPFLRGGSGRSSRLAGTVITTPWKGRNFRESSPITAADVATTASDPSATATASTAANTTAADADAPPTTAAQPTANKSGTYLYTVPGCINRSASGNAIITMNHAISTTTKGRRCNTSFRNHCNSSWCMVVRLYPLLSVQSAVWGSRKPAGH